MIINVPRILLNKLKIRLHLFIGGFKFKTNSRLYVRWGFSRKL